MIDRSVECITHVLLVIYQPLDSRKAWHRKVNSNLTQVLGDQVYTAGRKHREKADFHGLCQR